MAKAIYWQAGEVIDYVNTSDKSIEASTIMVVGDNKLIGVTGTNILPGSIGSLMVVGIFEMPKANKEILLGSDVYYDIVAEVITPDKEGNVLVGYAIAKSEAHAESVKVKLRG